MFASNAASSHVTVRVHGTHTHVFTVSLDTLMSSILDECPSLSRGTVRLFLDPARSRQLLYAGLTCRYTLRLTAILMFV